MSKPNPLTRALVTAIERRVDEIAIPSQQPLRAPSNPLALSLATRIEQRLDELKAERQAELKAEWDLCVLSLAAALRRLVALEFESRL